MKDDDWDDWEQFLDDWDDIQADVLAELEDCEQVNVFGAPCPPNVTGAHNCDDKPCSSVGSRMVYHRNFDSFANGSVMCDICGLIYAPIGEEAKA